MPTDDPFVHHELEVGILGAALLLYPRVKCWRSVTPDDFASCGTNFLSHARIWQALQFLGPAASLVSVAALLRSERYWHIEEPHQNPCAAVEARRGFNYCSRCKAWEPELSPCYLRYPLASCYLAELSEAYSIDQLPRRVRRLCELSAYRRRRSELRIELAKLESLPEEFPPIPA